MFSGVCSSISCFIIQGGEGVGIKGDVGETGAAGLQGPRGIQGPRGPPGLVAYVKVKWFKY